MYTCTLHCRSFAAYTASLLKGAKNKVGQPKKELVTLKTVGNILAYSCGECCRACRPAVSRGIVNNGLHQSSLLV